MKPQLSWFADAVLAAEHARSNARKRAREGVVTAAAPSRWRSRRSGTRRCSALRMQRRVRTNASSPGRTLAAARSEAAGGRLSPNHTRLSATDPLVGAARVAWTLRGRGLVRLRIPAGSDHQQSPHEQLLGSNLSSGTSVFVVDAASDRRPRRRARSSRGSARREAPRSRPRRKSPV
jgi:hypothetical protein